MLPPLTKEEEYVMTLLQVEALDGIEAVGGLGLSVIPGVQREWQSTGEAKGQQLRVSPQTHLKMA